MKLGFYASVIFIETNELVKKLSHINRNDNITRNDH